MEEQVVLVMRTAREGAKKEMGEGRSEEREVEDETPHPYTYNTTVA